MPATLPSAPSAFTENVAEGNSSAGRAARWLLALAVLLGLLRFVRLGHWSLWIDESLTYTDWHVGLQGGEIQNPLGYALIAGAVRVLGGVPDEFALRILPAIVGFLTIPLTWLAFRRFAGDLRASSAALILAASSWHVYWSQNARFYTFAQGAALAGAGLFIAGLARGSTVRAITGLVVIVLGVLFHPSVALLLPVLIVAPFVTSWCGFPLDEGARRVARRCLIAGAVGALIGAKWVIAAWITYRTQKAQYVTAEGILASIGHYLKTTGFFVTPLLAAAALCGLVYAWKRRERSGVFVAVVVAGCLLLALAAAIFVRVTAQYVFFLLPWIALLACMPITMRAGDGDPHSTRARAWPIASWIAILVLPACADLVLYFTVRHGERAQWKDAWEFVWNQRREGDLVLGMHASVGEYYLSPHNVDLRHPLQIGWLDYYHRRLPETWSRYPRRAWYVVNPEEFLDWPAEDADAFQRMLREECRLVKAYPLYVESRDLSVWVYLRE